MTPDSGKTSALQQVAGSRIAFRLREPRPGSPQHALILLHGVGGNETNLVALADGVADDTLVVFARGPEVLGASEFAWFRVAFTAQGPAIDTAQAEASRLALIEFAGCVQRAYGIDAQRTIIGGFSQGGILSASVALSAPESVRGFALLSGRILPELAPAIADKARLRGLHAFVGHGEQDTTLPVAWAERSAALLDELEVDYRLRRYPAGHTVSAAMHADFLSWLASLRYPADVSTM